MITTNSTVNIVGNINILGDMDIYNTTLTFSNSSIVVDGCVNLKNNTQIKIDLSKYNEKSLSDVTLIKSKSSCFNADGVSYITFNNPKNCIISSQQTTTDSLILVLSFNKCETSIGIQITLNYYLFGILIILINFFF